MKVREDRCRRGKVGGSDKGSEGEGHGEGRVRSTESPLRKDQRKVGAWCNNCIHNVIIGREGPIVLWSLGVV